MVSIGGNNLGFASIADCIARYSTRIGPCGPSQQAMLEQRIPAARAGVEKAIDEIRAVMTEAGYGDGDYRLIVQTYPCVVPRASEARYPESSPERTTQGCPFYDADLDWARDQAARGSARWSRPRRSRAESRPSTWSTPSRATRSARGRPARRPLSRALPASSRSGGASWARAPSRRATSRRPSTPTPTARARWHLRRQGLRAAARRFSGAGAAGGDVDGLALARVGKLPGDSERADARGCLSRRAAVGNRRIGRVGLGIPRAVAVLAAAGAPAAHQQVAQALPLLRQGQFGAGRRGLRPSRQGRARGHDGQGPPAEEGQAGRARGQGPANVPAPAPRPRREGRLPRRPHSRLLVGVRRGRSATSPSPVAALCATGEC